MNGHQPELRAYRPRCLALGALLCLIVLTACGSGAEGASTRATPTESYALSGCVTRAADQAPLQGVVIQFSAAFSSVVTGSDGKWSKEGLSGTVTVTPILPGWSFDHPGLQAFAAASQLDFQATAIAGDVQIMFLHHSTGGNVWGGGVPEWFDTFNAAHGTHYLAYEKWFDPGSNNPYDYWDHWVHNPTGPDTLASLVGSYKVIIWKHCFSVCNLGADTGSPDVTSSSQTAENYKLQYLALREQMHAYPNTQFIVWTGAVQAAGNMSADEAQRAKGFFDWVKGTWDRAGDNIFLWDFYSLETEGGLNLKAEYASPGGDSHPNAAFCAAAAPYFCNRIVAVIEGRGDTGRIDGKP